MAAAASVHRLPLVVILGSTGTGKSKLAIEIGKRIGGEILSADSMQVYKGLNIITNKVTDEERAQCPHHLLDFVSPLKEFSVVEFRNMALPLIDDIKKRGKIPIIVGGTNYYIESILWDILIDDQNINSEGSSFVEQEGEVVEPSRAIKRRKQMQSMTDAVTSDSSEITAAAVDGSSIGSSGKESNEIDECEIETGTRSKIETATGSETERGTGSKRGSLHEQLREIDPAMADRLHPNDTRKIARSLQVFKQKGIPHSRILEEQQQRQGGSVYGGPQRYENTCVFWLQCQREVLKERLDKRVDAMLDMGLITELLDFHREYNMVRKANEPGTLQYTEGIFQSIGFKEFHGFLLSQEGKEFDRSTALDQEKALLLECVENMKMVTRKYAKKQITWVKNRFLARPPGTAPSVYGLDATDLDNWECNVLKNALDILLKLMKGKDPVVKPLPRLDVDRPNKHTRYVCEVCDNRVILGEEAWGKHLVSKSHKWHVKKEQRNKERSCATKDSE